MSCVAAGNIADPDEGLWSAFPQLQSSSSERPKFSFHIRSSEFLTQTRTVTGAFTLLYRNATAKKERVHLPDFRKLDWLFPETTANFDKLVIQYRGFCGYTFAATGGLLLPGNPTIGILKYKEKYYTFNTRDAAYSFAENPEHYINLIKEKAKKNAELIQLLELHQQFETLIPYSQVNVGDTCSYLGL
ncbi:hypothetical protein U0070_024295 [Myodes glareolus]|uniref:Cilia- and flagella-associated protein 206 n=1 Tax=Myodes glareolus TaxID=447135 RepID=A0AAW0I9W5_MYOGA